MCVCENKSCRIYCIWFIHTIAIMKMKYFPTLVFSRSNKESENRCITHHMRNPLILICWTRTKSVLHVLPWFSNLKFWDVFHGGDQWEWKQWELILKVLIWLFSWNKYILAGVTSGFICYNEWVGSSVHERLLDYKGKIMKKKTCLTQTCLNRGWTTKTLKSRET